MSQARQASVATHGEAIDAAWRRRESRQTPARQNSAIWRALFGSPSANRFRSAPREKFLASSGNHQGENVFVCVQRINSAASAGRLSVSQVLAPGLSMVISAV